LPCTPDRSGARSVVLRSEFREKLTLSAGEFGSFPYLLLPAAREFLPGSFDLVADGGAPGHLAEAAQVSQADVGRREQRGRIDAG